MRTTERANRSNSTLQAVGPSPVIVASNREPYEHRFRRGTLFCQRTDGGLSSALDPALRRIGGVWVAWGSGEGDREATSPGNAIDVPRESPAYRLRRVWLTPEEIRGGYLGYANQVLWPLCHITLDRVAYRRSFWDGYQALNRRFADAILEELRVRPGPVWVHDFHLALLPAMIKESSPATTVSVFWHVPWPGPDIMRILPECQILMQSLLASDVMTFQTLGYRRAFARCAQEFLGATVDARAETAEWNGHRARLRSHGISVDFESFSDHARASAVMQAMTVAKRRLGLASDVRIGLGVDRLDYTKGLLKRLWALDCFFTQYPEYRGSFTFVQIAVPTRSEVEVYRRYRKTIWQTVLEINDRHGLTERAAALDRHGPLRASTALSVMAKQWQPVIFIEERLDFDLLVAYYRLADLMLVSSVNDGMNLVAKEYVASQVEEQGVLLVSQMAGAAEELTEAIVINPYDVEGVAQGIRQALEMPIEERRTRMRALREHVKRHDLYAWVEACLRDAGASEMLLAQLRGKTAPAPS